MPDERRGCGGARQRPHWYSWKKNLKTEAPEIAVSEASKVLFRARKERLCYAYNCTRNG